VQIGYFIGKHTPNQPDPIAVEVARLTDG